MLPFRFHLEECGAEKVAWLFILQSEVVQAFVWIHIIPPEYLSISCLGDDWTFLTSLVLMMDTDLCTYIR